LGLFQRFCGVYIGILGRIRSGEVGRVARFIRMQHKQSQSQWIIHRPFYILIITFCLLSSGLAALAMTTPSAIAV
jgi:hypothetical protein